MWWKGYKTFDYYEEWCMRMREIPIDLRLEPDIAEALQRMRDHGQDATQLANDLLRAYLLERKIIPKRPEGE